MRISFIDIDAHEKEINKTVEIHKYPVEATPASQPGFEAVFAIAATLVVAYLLRRRK
jgi:PGF-CTERM protein